MSAPLKVGDTNRAGTMEVLATRWDSNGTLTVQIAAPWPRTAKTEAAARRLARRCLMYPELTRSSRLVGVSGTVDDKYRVTLTFAVSRLDPRA